MKYGYARGSTDGQSIAAQVAGRHWPNGPCHPCRHPPIASATAMRVTAIPPQTQRKRQDRSVRRAEKRGCRARMTPVCGLTRSTFGRFRDRKHNPEPKRLICWPRQAILLSSGRPLGECWANLMTMTAGILGESGMKEFSGVMSEYKRKERGGGITHLASIPGGYVAGTSGGTLSNATVKIGDKYLLKLEVILGLDSYMGEAHRTGRPCTLYIHRRRLIGIKLDDGELYFYRKRVFLALSIVLAMVAFLSLFPLYYVVLASIIVFPLTILWIAVCWKLLWEIVYYFDGKKLEKLGGIPVSMAGDRLDLRSAI